MHESDYRTLLEETRVWYKTIGKIFCPALGADVVFNAKGFRHLLYTGNGIARTPSERIRRLQLVRYVPNMLMNPGASLSLKQFKNIQYWIIRVRPVTVIIRKTEHSHYFYHSVMDDRSSK